MNSYKHFARYPRSRAREDALHLNGWSEHYIANGIALYVDRILQGHLDDWRKDKICIEKYLTGCGFAKKCIGMVIMDLKTKGIIVGDWEGVVLGGTYVHAESLAVIKSVLEDTNMQRNTGTLISKAEAARRIGVSENAVNNRINRGLIPCVCGKVEAEVLHECLLKEVDQADFAGLLGHLESELKCKVTRNGREQLLKALNDDELIVSADSRIGKAVKGHWYVSDRHAAETLMREWIRGNGEYLERRNSKEYWLANVDQDFLLTINQLWQLSKDAYDDQLDGKVMPILYGTLKKAKKVQNYDNGDIQDIMQDLPEASKSAFRIALIRHEERKHGDVAYCKQNIQLHDDVVEQRKQDRNAYDYSAYVAMGVALYTKFAVTEGILARAVEDDECAQTLLYMALHIACAWRAQDMQLIYFGMATRKIAQECMELAKHGDFESEKYDLMWRAFEIYVMSSKAHKQNGQLVEACPLDFRRRLALILAIAEWHRDDQCRETIIERRVIGKVDAYKRLLTPEIYNAIFEGKRFHNSKMVKTLLKKHAELTKDKYDDIGLKGMPYRVASYLRAHKQELYAGPKTIFYYIDNCTDGYTSDEVLVEMRWDGYVGTYLTLMTEALLRNDIEVAGDDGKLLKKLDIRQQSVLMDKINVTSPLQNEKKLATLERFLADESRIMRDMPVNMAQMRKIAMEFTYEHGWNAKESHAKCIFAKLTGMQCKDNDDCPYCSGNSEGYGWCDLALYSRLYVLNLEQRRQNNIKLMKAYQNELRIKEEMSEKEKAATKNMIKKHYYAAAHLSAMTKQFISSWGKPEIIEDLMRVLEEEVVKNVFSEASGW